MTDLQKHIMHALEEAVGECKSIDEILTESGLPETDELDKGTLVLIDEHYFCCEQCGWFYDIEDRADCEHTLVCTECVED
jgi:hypothetical protein